MHTVININIHLPGVGVGSTELTVNINAIASPLDEATPDVTGEASMQFAPPPDEWLHSRTTGLAADNMGGEPPGPEAPDAPQISGFKTGITDRKPQQKAEKRGK